MLKSVFLVKSSWTSFVNLDRSTGTVDNFGISGLSASVFRVDKLVFKAKPKVSTCVISSRSFFVASLVKSKSTLIFPKLEYSGKYSLHIYNPNSFLSIQLLKELS